MVRSEHSVNNFFPFVSIARKFRISRHRNDCLPTLIVGQATVAVVLAFGGNQKVRVGRERSSMVGPRQWQDVF